MNKILENIHIVAFDVMGVIYIEPSLIKNGLYPIYRDKFSYAYVKDLYKDVRANVDGDISLWKGLGIDDPDQSRKEFLDKYIIDESFEEFRKFLSSKGVKKGIISNMPEE